MSIPIPVCRLIDIWNPLDPSAGPWEISVSRDDVALALSANRLVPTPGGKDHAGRIAYLVRNPAQDAIAIDVGIPSLGYSGPAWGIVDGNHRLAAAAFRGDAEILADVDGEVDWIAECFHLSRETVMTD